MAEKSIRLNSILDPEQIPAHLARSTIEDRLRNAILDGRLPCGMALRQQELATLFGVSRMPVREALRQLEAQGLLQVVQHKGAVIAPLITEDAAETYALRILLESEALRLSVPRLKATDFANARELVGRLAEETDFNQMGRLNRLFHMALYAQAPNKRLMRLVENGLSEEERFLRFNLSAMSLGKVSQNDHYELLDAVEHRNTALGVELLTLHLQRGVDAITRYLSQGQLA